MNQVPYVYFKQGQLLVHIHVQSDVKLTRLKFMIIQYI